MAEVILKHVRKQYGNVVAVHDFSQQIHDREFVVLVGPSGCGKTTTLRMVAGLEEVTSGEIIIDGRTVNNLTPKDRDVAMVFQSYALYPHMTVKENMALGLKLRKTPKEDIRRRVAETAELLGIENLLDRKPKALSGGQRQRVALGRAIVRVPRVYLFDEPLSNLDAKLRMHMRLELRKLHDRLKTTTIYVTHDQVEAMTMGDRIVVMKDGTIQQAGEPLDLYRKPANLFVAGFIGSPPMNVIPASVEAADSGLTVKSNGLAFKAPVDKSKALDHYRGRNVMLGLRPDDLSAEGGREISFNIRVMVAQSLGNRTYLEAVAGSRTLLASAGARARISSGQEIQVSIEPKNLHFFDPDTEKAIY